MADKIFSVILQFTAFNSSQQLDSLLEPWINLPQRPATRATSARQTPIGHRL
jgi:hypothetical protein